jgi:hypothetical protein
MTVPNALTVVPPVAAYTPEYSTSRPTMSLPLFEQSRYGSW